MHISADRERVYKAIATIDGVRKWWTEETHGNYEMGKVVNFDFTKAYQNAFEITDMKKDETVEWLCVGGSEEWVGTTVRFSLDDQEGKTRIRFAHLGYEKETDFMAQCS